MTPVLKERKMLEGQEFKVQVYASN
jgi:hypothetical protein